MAVRGPCEEQAAVLQQEGDRHRGLDHRRPREGAHAIVVASFGIHRRDDGEPVPAAEVEVLKSAAWRDVDDPSAIRGRHLLPGNHAMLDAVLDG